ncbi:hypothetical protein I5Q39_22105, partial [Serratia marcescens]|nr:hypothetical protein [Serratia marcescens]
MSVFLGIDVGGTVIKVGLYRASGEELAIAERDGAAVAPRAGGGGRPIGGRGGGGVAGRPPPRDAGGGG